MLSKNQIKLITRLRQKKHRLQEQCFVAEGKKVVKEFIESKYELVHLFTTNLNAISIIKKDKVSVINDNELKRISTLKNPNTLLGIFRIPKPEVVSFTDLIVVLDGINDPGNLGTIFRLCDWFGVEHLVCSPDTVDCYNPKVVQATMGSLVRVNVVYVELTQFLGTNKRLPIFGTFMTGQSIYNCKLPKQGIVVFGNETHGISKEVRVLIKHHITIPRFGTHQKTESLNVATAAAVMLSVFRQNYFKGTFLY